MSKKNCQTSKILDIIMSQPLRAAAASETSVLDGVQLSDLSRIVSTDAIETDVHDGGERNSNVAVETCELNVDAVAARSTSYSISSVVALPFDTLGDMLALGEQQLNELVDAMSVHQFAQVGTFFHNAGLLCPSRSLTYNALSLAGGGDVQVLRNVSGTLPDGTLGCVLGAPDSGASALVDVLAGRTRGARGTIRWSPSTATTLGYVPVADEHNAELTVRETIAFSAALRCGAHVPAPALALLVAVVARAVGLTPLLDAPVGGGGSDIRGLSGGERRRLSLALELVVSPAVLFAHQPTNGLDAATAAACMSYVKAWLHATRRSMLTTLVQPSPDLLLEFDAVVLMAKGAVLFTGAPRALLPHLMRLGYRVPAQKSWTELVEEVSASPDLFFAPGTPLPALSDLGSVRIRAAAVRAIQPTRAAALTSSRDVWQFAVDAWANGGDGGDGGDGDGGGDASGDNEHLSTASTHAAEAASAMSGGEAATPDGDGDGDDTDAGSSVDRVCAQLRVLFARQCRVIVRNPATVVARALPTLVFALVLGSVFFRLGRTQSDARTRVGALFFSVLQPVFENFPMVAVTFAQRPLFYAHLKSRFFRAPAYTAAQFAAEALLTLALRLAFALVAYFMIGMRGNFALYWLVSALASLGARAWMVFVASSVALEPVAGLVAPISLVVLLLFCGFVVPPASIPLGLGWLHHISFLTYAFRALVANEFADGDLYCTADELVPAANDALLHVLPPSGFGGARTCPLATGAAFAATAFDIDVATSAWSAFGALLALVVLLLALAAWAQWYFDHSKAPALVAPVFRDLAAHMRAAATPHALEATAAAAAPSASSASLAASASGEAASATLLGAACDAHTSAADAWAGDAGIGVAFDELSYRVGDKVLLDRVFGAVVPGEMTALMGASGCVCA